MRTKIGFVWLLFFTSTLNAAEMERSTMTSCAYQAGTAREIQTIRQTEGDDWGQFEQKVKEIYKDGQGRTDLLAIAKNVYRQSVKTNISKVYDIVFKECVKLTEGTADSA